VVQQNGCDEEPVADRGGNAHGDDVLQSRTMPINPNDIRPEHGRRLARRWNEVSLWCSMWFCAIVPVFFRLSIATHTSDRLSITGSFDIEATNLVYIGPTKCNIIMHLSTSSVVRAGLIR
jgi:hypothetical protein